jgi:hypothetical protein
VVSQIWDLEVSSGWDLLACAALGAGGEPRKNISLCVPDTSSARRAKEARAFASEAILGHGAGVDLKKLSNLLAIEGAALRGVGEQLAKLLERQIGHDQFSLI